VFLKEIKTLKQKYATKVIESTPEIKEERDLSLSSISNSNNGYEEITNRDKLSEEDFAAKMRQAISEKKEAIFADLVKGYPTFLDKIINADDDKVLHVACREGLKSFVKILFEIPPKYRYPEQTSKYSAS